jgi:anti-sigma factor RsiW
MSKPVAEFEISALIDGELDATRAAEVRCAIERDPYLRAQFEHLAEADHAWTAAARSAQFMPAAPRYELTRPPGRTYAWIATALASILIAGRSFPKFFPVELAAGMLIHTLMLAGVIAVVVRLSTVCRPSEFCAHTTPTQT